MKLCNALSFQLLFRVLAIDALSETIKKLTSLLMHLNYEKIRANIYITTEDKVVRRC